jgi:hypothetical protein
MNKYKCIHHIFHTTISNFVLNNLIQIISNQIEKKTLTKLLQL